MITVPEACLLGVVQGITEFLPVSSDGHLALVQQFLTPMPAEEKLAVDVALHAGTLAALIVYFWSDLWGMLRALLAPADGGWLRRWVGLLVAATVPAVAVGFPLKEAVAATYDSFTWIGGGFLFTGTVVWLASAVRGTTRREDAVRLPDAVLIGCFQALALLPGVSRSGCTISAGMFRRIRADVAARFSFLLGIPAVAGAIVTEGPAVFALGPEAHVPLAIGILVSAVTGLAAIWTLLRTVANGRLHWYAYYTWALGAVVLAGAAFAGR